MFSLLSQVLENQLALLDEYQLPLIDDSQLPVIGEDRLPPFIGEDELPPLIREDQSAQLIENDNKKYELEDKYMPPKRDDEYKQVIFPIYNNYSSEESERKKTLHSDYVLETYFNELVKNRKYRCELFHRALIVYYDKNDFCLIMVAPYDNDILQLIYSSKKKVTGIKELVNKPIKARFPFPRNNIDTILNYRYDCKIIQSLIYDLNVYVP